MSQWVVLTMPAECWRQIVSDIEDMCGMGSDEIEILQEAELIRYEERED